MKSNPSHSQKVNPTDQSAIAVWTASKGLRVIVLPFGTWWLIETQVVMSHWVDPQDVWLN